MKLYHFRPSPSFIFLDGLIRSLPLAELSFGKAVAGAGGSSELRCFRRRDQQKGGARRQLEEYPIESETKAVFRLCEPPVSLFRT
jgi:hypothetical protein